MLQTLINAWRIKELREKILFTLLMILIFRLGTQIVAPYVDAAGLLNAYTAAGSNVLFGYMNLLSGDAFQKATIFAMSITPYINASIIMQLLTVAIPALERMVKEGGEEGRKKQAAITRYLTVGIGLLQGFIYYITLKSYDVNYNVLIDGVNPVWQAIVIVASFTAGTAFIMWLGEQITEYGIGNGISIILFAGIISRIPAIAISTYENVRSGGIPLWLVLLMLVIALGVIGFIVFMTDAERRLPVQYAKRVVGRKLYGGQSTYIPLKVNMSGVMPIIFAVSIVSIPSIIASFFGVTGTGTTTWDKVIKWMSPSGFPQGIPYIVMYLLLIIGFSYFYSYISFNPVEVANNIKNNGGFIPGLRPGRPTSDFIAKVTKKITLIGALFLGAIAVVPIIASMFGGGALSGLALGGTSVLIVVGVALETVKQLEAQMMMRHYKGFLE